MSKTELITFGCRLNTYESEVMRQKADEAGAEDTLIFNTCAVTSEAVRQARQTIRREKRKNPHKKVIVTGCAAQIEPETFAEMDEVDLVLGNEEKLDAKNLVVNPLDLSGEERVRVNDIMSVRETALHMVDGFKGRSRAFVEVQNGCDHRCTFCIIPFGRGNSRSVAAGEVITQIKKLVAGGYNEVVLTGVDLTSYGSDLPGNMRLGDLVLKILSHVPELPRLRISSIDSIEADDNLMKAIKDETRLMPHFHLSLQSGDNMILKRMKRRHSREDAIRFCEEVRQMREGVVFGADFITGFPTETEDMFENTLKLVDECGLTFLHVFPFSPRPGTPAAKMPQLPKHVIKERADILRRKGEEAVTAHLNYAVGSRKMVLVESNNMGRTDQFTPVRFETPQKIGSLVTADLVGKNDHELLAREAQ